MLICEKLENVLPGIQTIEDGIEVYNRFYEKKLKPNSIILGIRLDLLNN
jgi:ASC-1-like (ASCH) protein